MVLCCWDVALGLSWFAWPQEADTVTTNTLKGFCRCWRFCQIVLSDFPFHFFDSVLVGSCEELSLEVGLSGVPSEVGCMAGHPKNGHRRVRCRCGVKMRIS